MNNKLSQHDIVYERPPVCWQDGLVMGNGSLGAVYYAPESLNFLINKTDVIDSRVKKIRRIIPVAEAEKMVKEGASAEDFQKGEILENEPDGAGPKTCCKLEMDIGITGGAGIRSAQPAINSHLSLSEACLNINLDKHLCHPRIRTFIDANSNTFVMRADNISRMVSRNNRIFFSRPEDIQIGSPELWTEANRVYLKMNISESGFYIVGMEITPRKTNGFENVLNKCRPKIVPPELGGIKIEVKGNYGIINAQGNFDLFMTVVTDQDTEDPFDAVNRNLDQAISSGFETLYTEHINWWKDFWGKSKVDLGDKTLNDLFYRSLYALGCSYRKAPMSGLLGLFYGPSPGPVQYTPWGGDLHQDLNIQCPFFPIFALNHGELFEAYRETYNNFLPEARRLAKDVFQAEGAHFDMCCNAHGKSYSQSVGKYRYAFMGSYVALIHCLAWKYKQDKVELKEYIYPFLKEVLKFYQSILKTDENGRFYMWPAHACELDVMDCTNPVQVVSMLKICLKTAIEATGILKSDQELKQVWNNILERLPEYPTGTDWKGRTIVFEGKGIHPDHHVGQAGCIHPVYPCGEIDEFSSEDLLKIYNDTFDSVIDKTAQVSYADNNTYYYQCVWACFFRAMTALRLGRVEDFWDLYMPMFLKAYVKPNGLCSHDACVCVDTETSEKNLENIPDEHLMDRDEKMAKAESWPGHAGTSTPNPNANRFSVPLIEANADFLSMITETLLQSHNGIIRIFPGWPKDKDASFENLVAEGDIKVSAELRGGNVCFIKLYKGKNCRVSALKVKSPWTGEVQGLKFPENGMITLKS